MDIFISIFKHTVMITAFVFVMMLVIEYINVLTQGTWQERLARNKAGQYLVAALLGGIPGCLGAFMVVAMYSHRIVSLGALVAAMIATSGDETFVMLAMIPRQSLMIIGILILVGIFAGALTDLVFKKYSKSQKRLPQAFEVHLEDNCNCFPSKDILNQWKRCTPSRGVLATTLAIFLVFLVIGEVGPGEWGWIKITILSSTLMGLFIVCTVPDHFIEEHLWEHVVKKHAPRVFMWTFGALLIMSFITGNMHLEDLVHDNTWAVMLAAALVGIIPESGPHLIFLTMYAKALIPVSIFIVSSIVQDGHGMLPLLAYSRRDFLVVKLINIVVGLVVGIVLLCFGL